MKRRKVPARVMGELKDAVKGRSREPRISELVQHFFDLAGGERNVAKMLLDEFNRPMASAATRSRILDLVLKSLQFTNSRSGGLSDLGEMTDEDIERELLSIYEGEDRAEEEAAQAGAAGPGPPGPEAGAEVARRPGGSVQPAPGPGHRPAG